MSAALESPSNAITTQEAETLFAELQGALVNTERLIVKIIQTQAWIPLGYETFAEAWTARMAGVRLSSDATRAQVVYAMLDNADDAMIESVVAGISGPGVAILRRQKSNGVPPEMAVVRRHYRKLPSAPKTVHVEVSESDYARWSDAATDAGSTLLAEASKALHSHFAELVERRAISG